MSRLHPIILNKDISTFVCRMLMQSQIFSGPRSRADVRAGAAVPQDKAPLPLPTPDGIPAIDHEHLQHPTAPHPARVGHETLAQDELGGIPDVVSVHVFEIVLVEMQMKIQDTKLAG